MFNPKNYAFQNEAVISHEKQAKKAKSEVKAKLLEDNSLSQYKIKGTEDDWKAALAAGKSQTVVSVKGYVC